MSLHDAIDADVRCTGEDCDALVRIFDADDARDALCPAHEADA